MTDNVRKLFELISQHPELSTAVTEATDMEQVISFAAEHGITVTKEDFERPDNHTFDENELAAVTGGKACGCVAGGGGEADPEHPNQTVCACPVIGMGICHQQYGDLIRCFCSLAGGGTNDWEY